MAIPGIKEAEKSCKDPTLSTHALFHFLRLLDAFGRLTDGLQSRLMDGPSLYFFNTSSTWAGMAVKDHNESAREGAKMDITTLGIDLAKNLFQVHGVDGQGRTVVQRQLRRAQLLTFVVQLRPCLVAMEACGSAHYWAREIAKRGHQVRLMSPRFVRPYASPCAPRLQSNNAAVRMRNFCLWRRRR